MIHSRGKEIKRATRKAHGGNAGGLFLMRGNKQRTKAPDEHRRQDQRQRTTAADSSGERERKRGREEEKKRRREKKRLKRKQKRELENPFIFYPLFRTPSHPLHISSGSMHKNPIYTSLSKGNEYGNEYPTNEKVR